MSDFLKSDKGIFSAILLFFLILLPFFWLKQGLLLIDTGREFYIPQQMLAGEILYKDIYNIYGPLSYQINAVIMAIFGQKIITLYLAGIINSIFILAAIYMLAREFLGKCVSCFFTIMIMFALIFPTFLYNSNLTYCFAIVYALSSFLISLLFLIKYIKYENNFYAYLSCLFAGISISNKYEFILYPIIILYVLCFVKPIGFKNGLKALSMFLITPLISICSLFIQGLNLQDIKFNYHLINNLINSPIIKDFFSKTGIFFDMSYIAGLIKNNQIFALFGFLPILNIILFITKFKEIIKDKPKLILILCAIIAGAKSFFFLNINHMGLFIFPICALATITMVSKHKYISIVLAGCILLFALNDISTLKYKNYTINTPKGSVNVYSKEAKMLEPAINFVLNNTNFSDKVVIMPEGSFINYATDRKGDNFFYNLSPLFYNDVFGENIILEHFKNNPPDYFIILPIDNIEYGSRFFGTDYAQNFYEMIINDYNVVQEGYGIKFYKRKTIK